MSLFGKPRQARFCGNYSLCVEISGFTFDGNLTTQSFKIRAVYEGLPTIDFLCETDLRSLFSLFLREKPRHFAHSFKRRMYKGTQNTATDGPKWRNGRRRGFKIPRREACRFESGLGYQIYFIYTMYRTDL